MNEFLSIKILAFCNLLINFLYTVFMIVTKPMNEAKDQDSNKWAGRTNRANTVYCPDTHPEKTDRQANTGIRGTEGTAKIAMGSKGS